MRSGTKLYKKVNATKSGIYPIAIFLKSYTFLNEHISTGVYKFD